MKGQLFLNLASDRGVRLVSRLGQLIPGERTPVPFEHEVGSRPQATLRCFETRHKSLSLAGRRTTKPRLLRSNEWWAESGILLVLRLGLNTAVTTVLICGHLCCHPLNYLWLKKHIKTVTISDLHRLVLQIANCQKMCSTRVCKRTTACTA